MPDVRVLNELQIKQNGVITTYKLGTVNGYYNSVDGKFYEDALHTIEIEGAPNLVYTDIDGNALYIYKTATSSFVKVSGEGSGGGLVYGYLNPTDGKFYEDSSYTTEISGDSDKLFITLDDDYIYRYDTTDIEFIQIGGSGSGDSEIVHVDTLPSSGNIENKIYEYGHAGDSYIMTNTGQSAINNVPCFEESSTASTYTVKATYEVIVGSKNVDNVVYNNSDGSFIVNFDDTTDLVVNSGDDVTFVVINNREYYLGDATNQVYVQINDYTAGSGISITPEYVISVVNRLEEKNALPVPSADYVGKYFLLTDEQAGFNKGYIYLCQQIMGIDPPEYEWIQTIESGGSGDGLIYVENLPVSPNIKNIIYGYYATVEDNKVVADDFLDNVEGFGKENDTYLPKNGYTITASSDTLTYKILTSLAKITNGYEATYEDTTNETFNTGDTFYYTISHMDFYAGDFENQTLYLLAGAGSGGGSGIGGGVINGYLNPINGKFYEDPGYTVEISGRIGVLYLDVSTNKLYRYDDFNAKYILVGDIEYTAGTGIDITNGVISGDYQAGFGIEIDNDTIKTTDFVGTQADWNSLTPAQQAEYDFVHITDDSSSIVYKPGHSISDGTSEKTQRDGLVFDGFSVTDDSTNEVTKIAEIPYTAGDGIEITNKEVSVGDEISRTWTGTKAEWDAISDKSIYNGWIINITDDAAVGSGPVVDVVEDGNLNAVTSNAVYDTFKVKKLSLPNKNTGAYGLVAIEGPSSLDGMLILRCEASRSDGTVGTVLAYPAYDKRYRTFYIRCVSWDNTPMLNVDMDVDVYYITVPL